MSFDVLPAELVLLTLDCIDSVTSLKDCCLVSKRFRAIAQPLLFHEITLAPEGLPQSLLLLCRTITTCPLIASQVRLFDIDTEKSELVTASDPDAPTRPGLSVADLGLMKIEAQNLRLNSIASFSSKTWATDSIILPILLISRFPNLRELFITLDPAGICLLTALVQARTEDNTSQSLSCLARFKTLHLACFQDSLGNEIDLTSITFLLSLLHLSKIQISDYAFNSHANEQGICNTIDTLDVPLGPLSISTISLCFSSMKAAGVQTLVNSCKELAAFYCGQCDSQPEQLNPQELYALLKSQRSTLRVLQLSFQDDSVAICTSPVFTKSQFGSLKKFDRLEYLTVDQLYLGNTPDLPSSLTHLVIQNCQTPIAQSLTYLANLALAGYLPSLESVSLHSDAIYPGGMLDLPHRGATDVLFHEACLNLQKRFNGTGITLRLDTDLLGVTARGYETAFEYGHPGIFWPFIYLE
ncbi:hypothetical protein BJX70DRAFT_6274 [Aspergillus crustosus]